MGIISLYPDSGDFQAIVSDQRFRFGTLPTSPKTKGDLLGVHVRHRKGDLRPEVGEVIDIVEESARKASCVVVNSGEALKLIRSWLRPRVIFVNGKTCLVAYSTMRQDGYCLFTIVNSSLKHIDFLVPVLVEGKSVREIYVVPVGDPLLIRKRIFGSTTRFTIKPGGSEEHEFTGFREAWHLTSK